MSENGNEFMIRAVRRELPAIILGYARDLFSGRTVIKGENGKLDEKTGIMKVAVEMEVIA